MGEEETRGQRIQRFREERGWTRQQLATYADVANSTIWRLETDVARGAHGSTIQAIADALNRTVEEIEGEPADPPPIDLELDELVTAFEQLPPAAREQVLTLARGLQRLLRERGRSPE